MFAFPWNICQAWVVLLFFQKQLQYTSSDFVGLPLGRPLGVVISSSSSHFHLLCRVLNLFSGIADVTYLHTITTNVSQSCYTTTHLHYCR
jgi:hypothetical protein